MKTVTADSTEPATYDVYFPEDSEVRRNVPKKDLQRVTPSGFWSTPVNAIIGSTFDHDGSAPGVKAKGTFVVGELGDSEKVNHFYCTRTAGGRKLCKWFDVGFVMRAVKAQSEKRREE